jgi:enterochelin esterase-like enzyme
MKFLWVLALFALTIDAAEVAKGRVLRIKVHGVGLEGNLSGDSPDRDVTVYLPPSYEKNTKRRYPVVYLLHGFTDSDEKWMGFKKHFINVPEVIDKTLAAGTSKEMIVVMPNAYTRFQGSMYSSSAVIGDWEGFVANELVAYIDGHYRTMAKPESRGLAGHSMGGYGTIRLAMKRPGIFSSVYAMSPCCLMPPAAQQMVSPNAAQAEAVKTTEEIEKANFGIKAMLASAAAWSPNPQNPPLYIDLPTKNGELQPLVPARWAANAPVAMADQYLGNLRRLKAIAIDIGDKDSLLPGARELDRIFSVNNLSHVFEIYDGNHVNHVSDRMETKVLDFFSRHLAFGKP